MTVVHNARTSGPTCPPRQTGGVRLSTYIENATTFVAAAGEIDASNIDRLTDHICAAITDGRALILDLSELTFFGAQGIPALFSVSEQCSRVGVDWAVVASHSVRRLLRIGDRDNRLPMVASIPEALAELSSPAPARRLLQLVTKSG
ncbi:MAG: STAS domain-containing protein [Mycobacteriaceae bacterium]|nr:STAS domain-containing protein [Mycobacteriaceae bacterium]